MTQNILRFIDEETKVRRVMSTFKPRGNYVLELQLSTVPRAQGVALMMCAVEEEENAGFVEIVRLSVVG